MVLAAANDIDGMLDPRLTEHHIVKDTDIVYKGGFVGILDSTGRVQPWDGTTNLKWLGVADETSETGDTAGTVGVAVDVAGRILRKYAVTGVTAISHVGDKVYATDDETLTLTANIAGAVGEVIRFYSSGVADVRLFTPNEAAASKLAAGNVSAIANLGVAVPFLAQAQTVSGTTNYNIALPPFAVRVVDAVVQKTGGAGGAGDTVKLTDGTNDITDAIDVNDADNLLSRPASIDDQYATIAAGGTLRVVAASDALALVSITLVRAS